MTDSEKLDLLLNQVCLINNKQEEMQNQIEVVRGKQEEMHNQIEVIRGKQEEMQNQIEVVRDKQEEMHNQIENVENQVKRTEVTLRGALHESENLILEEVDRVHKLLLRHETDTGKHIA